MNKIIIEKYLVVFLFFFVIVVFSFAQRDSRKLDQIYNRQSSIVNRESSIVSGRESDIGNRGGWIVDVSGSSENLMVGDRFIDFSYRLLASRP